MSNAEKVIQHVKNLSEPLVLEVLHYIEFLETKQNKRSEDMIEAQKTSMQNIWENEEDKVWDEY